MVDVSERCNGRIDVGYTHVLEHLGERAASAVAVSEDEEGFVA